MWQNKLYSILFYSILFYSILFYSILFPFNFNVNDNLKKKIIFSNEFTWHKQHYGFLHLRQFVHTNLPRAGFELRSLGQQANALPIDPTLLVPVWRVYCTEYTGFLGSGEVLIYCPFTALFLLFGSFVQLFISFNRSLIKFFHFFLRLFFQLSDLSSILK